MDQNPKKLFTYVSDSNYSQNFYMGFGAQIAKDLSLSELVKSGDNLGFSQSKIEKNGSFESKNEFLEIKRRLYGLSKDDILDITIEMFLINQIASNNSFFRIKDISKIKTRFLKYLQSKKFKFTFKKRTFTRLEKELHKYLESENLIANSRKINELVTFNKKEKNVDILTVVLNSCAFFLVTHLGLGLEKILYGIEGNNLSAAPSNVVTVMGLIPKFPENKNFLVPGVQGPGVGNIGLHNKLQSVYQSAGPLNALPEQRVSFSPPAQGSLTSKHILTPFRADSALERVTQTRALIGNLYQDIRFEAGHYAVQLLTPPGIAVTNVGMAGGYNQVPGDNLSVPESRMLAHRNSLIRGTHHNHLFQFTYDYFRDYFDNNQHAIKHIKLTQYSIDTPRAEMERRETEFIHEVCQHGTLQGKRVGIEYGATQAICVNLYKRPKNLRNLTKRDLEFLFEKDPVAIAKMTQADVRSFSKYP